MIRRCHPFSWSFLMAVAALSASTLVSSRSLADDDFDSIVANDYEAELCGWGTHDSCPIEVAENIDEPLPTETTPRPLANLDESLAALATAACASAGVSVEQIVEPFAMVGPHFHRSLESVKNFQQWWQTAAEQASRTSAVDPDVDQPAPQSSAPAAQVNHVPIVDFDGELTASEPATENLASATEPDAADDIEITAVADLDPSFADDHCWYEQSNDGDLRDELMELAAEEPLDVLDDYVGDVWSQRVGRLGRGDRNGDRGRFVHRRQHSHDLFDRRGVPAIRPCGT